MNFFGVVRREWPVGAEFSNISALTALRRSETRKDVAVSKISTEFPLIQNTFVPVWCTWLHSALVTRMCRVRVPTLENRISVYDVFFFGLFCFY